MSAKMLERVLGSNFGLMFGVVIGPLIGCYPIFCMVYGQHASVSDLLVCSNGSLQWDICFTRAVQNWELDNV